MCVHSGIVSIIYIHSDSRRYIVATRNTFIDRVAVTIGETFHEKNGWMNESCSFMRWHGTREIRSQEFRSWTGVFHALIYIIIKSHSHRVHEVGVFAGVCTYLPIFLTAECSPSTVECDNTRVEM